MDCKRCAEDLTAYLDNELSPEAAKQVRSHLSTCSSCTDELRSLKEAGEFFTANQRELEPRPESWNLIRAHISESVPASSGFGFHGVRWRFAIAAMALCAAAGLGYLQYEQKQKESLESYISRYEQDRRLEANRRSQPAFWGDEGGSRFENPYASNPFIEIKATADDNPFRTENR